jgi:hypothetical protein
MECRALLEGWLIDKPEKRASVVSNLLHYASGMDGTPADQIAAAKALMATELSIAKMDQDKSTASQAKVIVVRRVDAGPAPLALESGEGTGDCGQI